MRYVTLAVLGVALAAACTEQSTPTAPPMAVAADRTTNACPTRADVIVHDEAGLAAALSTAHSGEVIGISGYFALATDQNLNIANVTLTCATRGAGMYATESVSDMLIANAPGVTVDHLVLDAARAGDAPFYAHYDGSGVFGENVRFTNNTVTCTPGGECLYVSGGRNAVITDNHFGAAGAVSGVHVESGGPAGIFRSDGARIERNTIIANSPSGLARFGAIRTAILSDAVVSNNTIVGPWSNGISAVLLARSRIEGNRITGVSAYGIAMTLGVNGFLLGGVRDNTIRKNLVHGAGVAGVYGRVACNDQFSDNDFSANAGNLGIIFPDSSGANVVSGDHTNNYRIQNDGAFDCNGDGVNDPNVIVLGSSRSN